MANDKYKNLTLITLNNVLHIKADNLEPVEVDSSCVDEIRELVYIKFYLSFNLLFNNYLKKGINISELSDRIEVRNVSSYPPVGFNSVPKAFLLPVKEDNAYLDKKQNKIYKFENANLSKLYTIEEIEKAIRITNDNEGQPLTDRFITNYINNLKK